MLSPCRAFLLCILTGLASFCGCQQSAQQPEQAATPPPADISTLPSQPVADPLVATVNGEEIRHSDLIRHMNEMARRGTRLTPQDAVNGLIAHRLLAQAAVETGQIASASEVQEAYDSIAAQVGGEATFEMQLAQMGTTPDQVRDDLQRQLSLNKVVTWKTAGAVAVADASVEAFYKDNSEMFERVRARHILIRSSPSDPEEKKAEARKRIEAIAERLQAGEDFAEIAKAESEDSGSGAQGGDLPEFGHGRMVPPFEQAAFALQPGQTSDIVQTQYGYHLIQTQEHRTLPLDELRPRLRDFLEDQQRDQIIGPWVDELRAKATIEIIGLSQPGGTNPQ